MQRNRPGVEGGAFLGEAQIAEVGREQRRLVACTVGDEVLNSL